MLTRSSSGAAFVSSRFSVFFFNAFFSFETEWRDLGRLLEQVSALLTCCLDHGSDIHIQDKRLKEKAQIGAASKSFDDKDSKKGQVKNNWMVARDKASQKASIDRVQSFEEAFLQIKNATGIDNIDELVQTFIDAEDQNFSLYLSKQNHALFRYD
jgi:activator of HSP90 ATPase